MSNYRVDPRIRAYGKARIDITRRAKDEQEWQRLWKEPRYPFPFQWGNSWKSAFQYLVEDFAAEIGFLMDVLGLPVYSFSTHCATFTSPDEGFAITVVAAAEEGQSTPPDTLRIQFMVRDLFQVVEELERRGIKFEQRPQEDPEQPYTLQSGFFRTPHGICIDLISAGEAAAESRPTETASRAEAEPEEDNRRPVWQEIEKQLTVEDAAEENPFSFLDEDLPPEDRIEAEDQNPFGFESTPEEPPLEKDPESESSPLPLRDFETEDPGLPPEPGDSKEPGETSQNSPPADPPRRSDGNRLKDASPRTNLMRRSGALRGNGELRGADISRRPDSAVRRNPFSYVDIPPLPDLTDRRSAASPRPDKPNRPPVEERQKAPLKFDPPEEPAKAETEAKSSPPDPKETKVEEEIKYEDIDDVEKPEDFEEFFS